MGHGNNPTEGGSRSPFFGAPLLCVLQRGLGVSPRQQGLSWVWSWICPNGGGVAGSGQDSGQNPP